MKKDVAQFELHLEDNLFTLRYALVSKSYAHDPYDDFYVCDPKRRHIHKASVRDRVLHQALFRILYPVFDRHFIHDSYSSRVGKGTHAGIARLQDVCRKVTKNWNVGAYVLKCDVRKFFDSIDHAVLRNLIVRKVDDPEFLWLLDIIFASFEKEKGKGLPLGNVTSQLFANVYLDELDQFAKHELKARHYFRYCDDFVIVHRDRRFLCEAVGKIREFLASCLLLELHPDKIEIRKVSQGVDFLGHVLLSNATVVRTRTGKRMVRKMSVAQRNFKNGLISEETLRGVTASYLGVLSHGKNRQIRAKIWKYGNL